MNDRPITPLRNRRVLVMGLGAHGGGASDIRWLVRQGARVTVTDVQPRKNLRAILTTLPRRGVTLVLGRHRKADFARAHLLLQNPAVPSTSPYVSIARQAGVEVVNGAVLFFERCPAPIVGITGSKGKTTTAHLLAAMLRSDGRRVHLVGVEGQPVLETLDCVRRNDTIVFELSSWRIERLAEHGVSPHVGVLTALYRDHLNRYPSYAAYLLTKAGMFSHQTLSGVAIVNRDQADTRRVGRNVPGKRYWFSRSPFGEEQGGFIDSSGRIVFRQGGRETTIARQSDIRLPGGHNVMNVLAAVTAGKILGASNQAVRRTIRSFAGLPHRLEVVRRLQGVTFVNDSAATIPDATVAAIRAIPGPIALIAGGSDKRLDFTALAQSLPKRVRSVSLLPGDASTRLTRLLRALRRPVGRVGTIEQGIARSLEALAGRGTVLLSPGAASFTTFRNEFERGAAFRSAAKALRRV